MTPYPVFVKYIFPVGVEAWARRGTSVYTTQGLKMLEEAHQVRILNDQPGLMVFETVLGTKFIASEAEGIRGASAARFLASCARLALLPMPLTERERIAVDIFNMSFFEPAADVRLLTLVMAVEAFIERRPRSQEAIEQVDLFIKQLKEAAIPKVERESMVSALTELRFESIGAAAKSAARHLLGAKVYMDMTSETFIGYCYGIRSRIIHGSDARKTMQEAAATTGHLEVFVADLLTARFASKSTVN